MTEVQNRTRQSRIEFKGVVAVSSSGSGSGISHGKRMPNTERALTYIWHTFCRKLHENENEKIWTDGAHIPYAP